MKRDTDSIEKNTEGAFAAADAYLQSTAKGMEADARRQAGKDAARKGQSESARIALQQGLADAQAAEAAGKSTAALRDQTDMRQRFNAAVAAGTITVQQAARALQDEAELRDLIARRDAAATAHRDADAAKLTAQIAARRREQGILNIEAVTARLKKLGFTPDGIPLGPMAVELRYQGDDLAFDRNLMGIRKGDKTAFVLSDTTLQFANGDTVVTRFNLLYAADGANAAAISEESEARVSAVAVEASNRFTLAAQVASNQATFYSFKSAQADTNSATTTGLTVLNASVASQYSTISEMLTVQAGLMATYSIALDVNGHISGARYNNDGSVSSMIFLSDVIGFTDRSGDVYPLTVSGGWVTISRLKVDYVSAGVIDVVHMAPGTRSQSQTSFGLGAVTYGSSDTFISGVTIPSKGGRHRITFDCSGDSVPSGTPESSFTRFLLYRDDVQLTTFWGPRKGLGGSAGTNFEETPGPGNHTYEVYAREEGGGVSYTAFNRFLAIEETVI